MPSEPIKKFIEAFSSLPSLGPRQATRLAYYIANLGREKIQEIAAAVSGLHSLKTCGRCFRAAITEKDREGLCDICGAPGRNQKVIAIVEKETDLLSLENTKKISGRYLLLGELSREGVLTSAQKMRLNHLKRFIEKNFGQAEEIIVALSHTTYGNLDASLVIQELKPYAEKITRLGRGLPTGGEIEFADDETLGSALEQRR